MSLILREKHLVDGKYSIKDLVDLKELRALFQSFTDSMGFTIGFLNVPELEILIATGWRDLCTKYHRHCPLAAKRCRRSNARLVRHLNHSGQIVIETCANGLVDCATPIIIKGKKIAILATGQVCIKPPDIAYFKKQARLFGCNEAAYLRALKEIPVIPEKKLKQVTRFLGKLAHAVTRMGYDGLAEKERTEKLSYEVCQRKKTEDILSETAGQLRSLNNNLADGMVYQIKSSLDGLKRKFTFVSSAVKRFHKLTVEKTLRDPSLIYQQVLEEDRPLLAKKELRAARTKTPLETDVRIRLPSGEIRWRRFKSAPRLSKEKRVLLWDGIEFDITELKTTERMLKDSEMQYRKLFENSHDAMMSLEPPSWRFTSANISMLRMFKAKNVAELCRHSPWALSPRQQPDGRDSAGKAREMIQTAMRKGSHFFEWTHRRLNGEPFPAEVLLTRGEKTEGGFLQATVRDITERKRAEANLARRMAFDEMMTRISNRFAVSSATEMDVAIESALCSVGQLFGSERVFIALIDPVRRSWSGSHEWRIPKIPSVVRQIPNVPFGIMRWSEKKLLANQVVQINSIQSYPSGASTERRFHKKMGIKSAICVPMLGLKGKVFGYISLHSMVHERIWSEEHATQLRMIGNTIAGAIERAQAEEALRASEQQLQLQFRRMPLACILWSPDFRVMLWNPTAEKIFGYKASEARGKKAYELIVPKAVQPEVASIWKRLLHGDASAHSINENVTKFGKTILCKWTNTPLRQADGKVIGILSMAEDITEIKKAEDSLRENERQLRQIIDAVPHMIFAKDTNGRFLLVNQATAMMYDKKPAELVGLRRQDVHPVPEEVKKYLNSDREILTAGKPKVSLNEIFTDIHGRVHILQTIKLPFRMAGKQEDVILGVSVDVTEQKKIEDFRNDIVRTVSHELRTPLSIQKEGLSLILDGSLGRINQQQKEVLTVALRNIGRLTRMITSLLNISKIEAGKIELKKEMVNLQNLARGVVLEFKEKAEEKKIQWKLQFSEDSTQVYADPDKITQVFSNLIDNALKFTQHGSIEISIRVLNDEVECGVQDSGIGIAAENLSKVFEKFQQFSRVSGPGEKGLGLGLSICKGLIELHGGRIWVQSHPGRGTKVTFVLPQYREGSN